MILVTGGAGFIGSTVVRELLARKHKVRVIDNMSKPSSRVPEGVEFVRADLADREAARQAMRGVRACINLAARIGGIGYFHRLPATILSENNLIYSNTFEAAVEHKIERMIFVSSSMVFESAHTFPSREDELLKLPPPFTAYGFSKLVGEWYCRAFYDQYGLPYTICRPFNAIGPEEEAGDEVGEAHVIPDLIKKVLSGQSPLELLGDGKQTRCFTHVRDIARGIVMALESSAAEDEDFNLSSAVETRILDLARRIWDLCRPGTPFRVQSVPSFQYDVQRRVPEVGKAAQRMNWRAEISLEEGLEEVVRWQRERSA